MRVLHLIDAASPQATATTLALLAESLGRLGRGEQAVLLLGGDALTAAASAAGLPAANTVACSVPFGFAPLAWPAVRCRPPMGDTFDLVHCWSLSSLALATLRWPGRARIITLTQTPSPRAVRWLSAMVASARRAPTVVLACSATIRRELLAGGMAPPAVHLLRPGIDMSRTASTDRQALRDSWGASDPRTRVVALLSDPPQDADTLAAGMAAGLASESYDGADDPAILLLVHPEQRHRRRMENLIRRAGRMRRLVQEPLLATPWSVLPACDLALTLGPSAGGLSLLWAMAANVPIVAEATYAVSEVVEDHHSALLTRPDQPKALACRITQLLADAHLAWRLRDTARHEAYSFFSRQRYCQSVARVYEQTLAGQAIEIPPLEPTGGLRFTGRA